MMMMTNLLLKVTQTPYSRDMRPDMLYFGAQTFGSYVKAII
jgi:hypothetical protein